jgi:hypothetical protein
MKRALGILAIASVLSFAMIGCTPQAEGDTAPAPTTEQGKPGVDSATKVPVDK